MHLYYRHWQSVHKSSDWRFECKKRINVGSHTALPFSGNALQQVRGRKRGLYKGQWEKDKVKGTNRIEGKEGMGRGRGSERVSHIFGDKNKTKCEKYLRIQCNFFVCSLF